MYRRNFLLPLGGTPPHQPILMFSSMAYWRQSSFTGQVRQRASMRPVVGAPTAGKKRSGSVAQRSMQAACLRHASSSGSG